MSMNEKELKARVAVLWKGYGTYQVTIKYRRQLYTCVSHNSLAYDDLDRHENNSYYTSKQAYRALYDECKQKNNLI